MPRSWGFFNTASAIYFAMLYEGMIKAPINAIYLATEGEGLHIGTPQVFVRLQGCAIGCLNCDSKDTWDFNGATTQTLSEVLERVREISRNGQVKRVSITGGDPLHPKHHDFVLGLCGELKKRGHQVVLEAAGMRVVHAIFDLIDFIHFDFKTPSTGVTTRLALLQEMMTHYSGRFQVKSVVETRADFDACVSAYESLLEWKQAPLPEWILTPSYNLAEAFPRERFLNVIEWNQSEGAYFRVIGQQHKWLYGPDIKEV